MWVSEVDAESVSYLNTYYPQLKPNIIHGDFLQLDLTAIFGNEKIDQLTELQTGRGGLAV